jgi:hypothetical protein
MHSLFTACGVPPQRLQVGRLHTLVLGIFIGLWIGAPLGILLIALFGPREREVLDPRSMHDLLARRYPSDGAVALNTPAARADISEHGRRHA